MNPDQTPAPLPAPLPPTAALLLRAQGALGLLREVVQESSAEYWYERGKALQERKQWDDAIYAFQKCTECDADYWRGWLQLALTWARMHQGDIVAASLIQAYECCYERICYSQELDETEWNFLQKFMEQCRSTTQDSFKFLLGLALAFASFDQQEARRRILNEIEASYSNQCTQSALWFLLSGDTWDEWHYSDWFYLDDLLPSFDRAIELRPDYILAYIRRADTKANRAVLDYEGGIIDYNYALSLRPNITWCYQQRAWAKFELEDYKGAISDFNRSIELSPICASYYESRASVKEEIGDIIGADIDRKKAKDLIRNA